MATDVQGPSSVIEEVAELRLPSKADDRLQALMDRNTDGLLTPEERDELESLVELSETIAVLRAKALHTLGRNPR